MYKELTIFARTCMLGVVFILVICFIGWFFKSIFQASQWDCVDTKVFEQRYTEVISGKLITKTQQATTCLHYRR